MPHPALTLVVLAAGMGSRYGGMKQLEPVGPGGATLMDYSVHDAILAGFHRVVFVIRPNMEEAFGAFAAARFGRRIEVATAHQRLEAVPPGVVIPPGRAKPWGTSHAVLAAEAVTRGPFAVVNADDFYGRAAIAAAAAFLREPGDQRTPTFALVAYPLAGTLSPTGGVNRGICRVDAAGWLQAIEEVKDIRPAPAPPYPRSTVVSMNLWCFTPAVFPLIRDGFATFLAGADLAKGE